MEFTPNAKAALQQPDTQMKTFDMPPERKARMEEASSQIVDLLMKLTNGPIEAYFVLHFVARSIEEATGIRGGILIGEDDKAV